MSRTGSPWVFHSLPPAGEMSPSSVTERVQNLRGKHSEAKDGGASEGVRKGRRQYFDYQSNLTGWLPHPGKTTSRQVAKAEQLPSETTT